MVASVRDLTKQSGFVFEGTVRRIGDVTSPGVQATPSTAVVHVEKVLKGPPVLTRFSGREITVLSGEHSDASSRKRAVFFTNAFHYGEGLAVREVGRSDATGADVEREVHEAMKESDDENLLRQLRNARLVVRGIVTKVAPSEHRERVGSEHDPEWWECVIEVEAIEKGSTKHEKNKTGKLHITAFFAHSTDVAWYKSPKAQVGDAGIFILHEGVVRSRQTPGPAMVHPLDFQPASEAERVRTLLKRIAQ
jgi:hypothetical protein